MMDRKLEGRRTSSKLLELVELVMANPLVSAGMVVKAPEMTPQATRRIVLKLALREMTGRGGFERGGDLRGYEETKRAVGFTPSCRSSRSLRLSPK